MRRMELVTRISKRHDLICLANCVICPTACNSINSQIFEKLVVQDHFNNSSFLSPPRENSASSYHEVTSLLDTKSSWIKVTLSIISKPGAYALLTRLLHDSFSNLHQLANCEEFTTGVLPNMFHGRQFSYCLQFSLIPSFRLDNDNKFRINFTDGCSVRLVYCLFDGLK